MTGGGGDGEHPVFGRLRQLLAWHRVAFLLGALTAGKWVSIMVAGAVFHRVPQAELLLSFLQLGALVALFGGLAGFVRLAPWSVPALEIALVACLFPLSRTSDLVGSTAVAGQQSPVTIPLTRLDAPSLALGFPLVPLGLAAWLWTLRGTHRRVALESPLGASVLRPRRLAMLVAAALFALPAVPVASYLAGLEDGPSLGADEARARVEASLTGSGVVDRVSCSRASEPLGGPLLRPFHFVIFVGERRGVSDPVPVAGARRVDARSGAVSRIGRIADVTPDPATPRTSAELCAGISVEVSVRTETRPPWPL